MKEEKKKILLIGGAGFIGHNLALEYIEHGHDVTIVDSLQINNFLYVIDSKSEIHEPKLYGEIINDRLSIIRSNKINLLIGDFRDINFANQIRFD